MQFMTKTTHLAYALYFFFLPCPVFSTLWIKADEMDGCISSFPCFPPCVLIFFFFFFSFGLAPGPGSLQDHCSIHASFLLAPTVCFYLILFPLCRLDCSELPRARIRSCASHETSQFQGNWEMILRHLPYLRA
ncbi:uncharacterized protein BDW47DRAFT_55915 [Aspergillus candidus]|uniref:Uncharacterized protein n=1 Tax=Aspergillus candidus TaxID=41067 RepID=A0A2I2FLM1_ASPCN|nr:hypothetical protein BDW47DRAFT_55915 [Aspergillus candidus]PLB41521.1 hypothetical protein BDW47DRAFT_55915 [Aspergillus candidus]